MVGVGMLMLAVSWSCAWVVWRQRRQAQLQLPRLLLMVLVGMAFSGWVATLAGWYVTEIGRQPYVVYGFLLTSEAVADHAPALVGVTLVAYVLVYSVLLVAYIAVLKYMSEHPLMPTPAVAPPVALATTGQAPHATTAAAAAVL